MTILGWVYKTMQRPVIVTALTSESNVRACTLYTDGVMCEISMAGDSIMSGRKAGECIIKGPIG